MARVQTQERAVELMAFCRDHGIHAMVQIAPSQAEDLTDIERALIARQPVPSAPKVGRNEPCTCGSGKKFKKCCEGRQPQTAS